MPIYRYKAYERDGGRISGTIEGDSISHATRILKDKGFYPEVVTEESARKDKRSGTVRLSTMTRQLAILTSASVPIAEAVRTLSEQETGAMRDVLVGVREKLEGGSGLSKAIEAYPDVFPEYYVNMINAGESGGGLDMVLDNLADFLDTESELKNVVQAAAVYPLFMLGVSMVVLFFIFSFVVPKITRIFEDSHSELPLVTTILIIAAHGLKRYWWLLGAAAYAVYRFAHVYAKRNQEKVGALLYKVPVLQALYVARFTRLTGFLLKSGVPVLRVLRLTASSIGNKFAEARLLEAEKLVAAGSTLHSALGFLPPVVRQILATGEKTGELANMLLRTAGSFESDFRLKVKRLLSMLEPTMILIMGLIVGFIVFAVLLPIFELNRIIK